MQNQFPRIKNIIAVLVLNIQDFQTDIKSAGTATITQFSDTLNPDLSKLQSLKIAPAFLKEMIVQFKGDSILLVKKPVFSRNMPAETGKTYQVSYWIKNQGCKYMIRMDCLKLGTEDINHPKKWIDNSDTIPELAKVRI